MRRGSLFPWLFIRQQVTVIKASPEVTGFYQPEGRPKLIAGEAYNPADDFDILE